MSKQLRKVELNIVGVLQEDASWKITTSADLTVGLSEYPDYERRKGIAVILTPAEELTVKNFVATVVLPQAEVAK
jgi:hypothetical protein